ncbi:hypothetical protein OG730_39310 [Streptomyces sp. NBC_01298]|uniref:hypothetical protein n=1 Tax=Streptomyces sp. NBC_01298 TaxID=2903817 RepID=UPI002E132927|nr:hypothetical protein OG730_39310 [Streptomyces sp. NBC_01298]
MAVAAVPSVPSAHPIAGDAAQSGHRAAAPNPVDTGRTVAGRPPAPRRVLATAGPGGARGCGGRTALRLTRAKARGVHGDPSPRTGRRRTGRRS